MEAARSGPGFSSRAACRLVVAAPDQVPGVHEALALDLHIAAFLEHERVADPVIDVLRHLNSAGDVGGLHTRGDVDGVAPDVVEEFAGSDHPGHHRPGGQADPQRHGPPTRIFQVGDGLGEVEGQAAPAPRCDRSAVWVRRPPPCRNHRWSSPSPDRGDPPAHRDRYTAGPGSRTRSVGVRSLARSVYPAISANRIDASS